MNTLPFTPPGKKNSGDSVVNGVDLSVNFAGIKAPNPFWLASAQIGRASCRERV